MSVQEKILNYLKERMVNTSLSERTLSSIAQSFGVFFSDENALTDENLEQILTHAKSLEGQYSHDLSLGLEEAKKKITSVAVPPKKGQETHFELPEDVKKKLESYDKLFNEIEQEKAAAKQKANDERLSAEIKNALLGKGCKEDVFLKLTLTQIDYTKDLNSNVERLKGFYDGEVSDAVQKGGFVPQAGGITGAALSEEEMKKNMEESLKNLKDRNLI